MDRRSNGAWLLRCALVLMCLTVAASAFAQGAGSAALQGTVVDNVGVVPGATVTITNAANGAVRTAVSNEQGIFRFNQVAPGAYNVKITMEGFKAIDVANLPLLSGEVRDLQKQT